jgi:hypothetical protein
MAGCVRDGRVHLSVCDIGDLAVEVTCRVANTGRRRGKEVAQLYVGDPEASVARPPRELKAFAKVDLDAGETETLTFRLDARDLSYWSPTAADWVLEAGEFALAIGASSRDLRLRITIDIAAPPARVALDGMATLAEWLADPDGAALLLEAVGTDEQGRPGGIVGDDELAPSSETSPSAPSRPSVAAGSTRALSTNLSSGYESGAREVVARLRGRFVRGRGGPAGQEVEGLLGAAARFGGEDRQPQSPVGCELHDLVAEFEVADDGMMQPLGAGLVVADVVRRPPRAKRVAAGRQLADEIRQRTVVGVTAGHRAQGCHEVLGRLLPVDEELLSGGVEEGKRALLGGCSRLSNNGA